MRCDECVYWSKHDQYDEDEQLLGVRRCNKVVALWEASEWTIGSDHVAKPEYSKQKMFIMDGSGGYRASLHTMPDFFCAHFEPALNEKES